MKTRNMKIVSVAEMRAADQYTIEKGTPPKELMRRAAQGIFDVGKSHDIWQKGSTLIVCGSGNNGGDGYALAEIAVKSDLTVSIGFLKEGFFRGRARDLIGDIDNVDIGIELPDDILNNNQA